MQRVLKASGPGGRPWRRIAAEAWRAGESASAILARAEIEAEVVRRAAETERLAAVESGRSAGHEEGLARAGATLLAAAVQRDRWLDEASGEALDLATDMARRLVGRELRLDPGAVRAAAEEALAAARGRRLVTLRLHPDGADALAAMVGGPAGAGGHRSVTIQPDATLAPADVVIETEAGLVDARLEVRLEALRAALSEPP